ncbi:thioredoxin [Patescibacteria group bacterium]
MDHVVLTAENFKKQVLDDGGVVLVDFWAPWCGPCKMINPMLDEISEKYSNKIKIAKLNVDETGEIATKYNIMSIPTLLFFKGGKVQDQTIGMQDKKNITDKIDELIK